MKHAQSLVSETSTLLVMVGLAWGVSACTHSAMSSSADSGVKPPAAIVAVNLEPRYFGEQFASQQLALQAKDDELPVDTF
jgi:hypothetical protein